MKYIFILIALIKFKICYAQISKIYKTNDSFLSIYQKTPFDGSFTVIHNNNYYNFFDNNFSNFRVLNKSYFTCFNKELNQNCVYKFEDSICRSAKQLNIDSIHKEIISKYKLISPKIYSQYVPGNDTICLLFTFCKSPDFKNLILVYQFNLKKRSIDRLILDRVALSIELGNDPISRDFKLGFLINEEINSSRKFVIYNIEDKKIEYEKLGVEHFSFTLDSTILISYLNSSYVEIYRNYKLINIIKIKKNFIVSDINYLLNSSVLLKIKKNRRIGERFKIRNLYYNTNSPKLKRIKIKSRLYL